MALVGKRAKLRRSVGDAPTEHGELWLVSYADMVTLLFGFFVILYSLTIVDEKSLSAVGRQLAETFRGDVDKKEADTGILMEARQIRALQMLIAMLNLGDPEQAVERIEKLASSAKNLETAKNVLSEQLKDKSETLESLRPQIISKENVVEIALPDTMMFESGTADLTPKARQGLRRLAQYLLKIQGLTGLEVVGHTDSLAPSRTSKFPSNWALSSARAGAVAEELIKHGVSPKSLITRGMASLQPLFPERRADGSLISENLSKNRRVSVLIKKTTDPTQR